MPENAAGEIKRRGEGDSTELNTNQIADELVTLKIYGILRGVFGIEKHTDIVVCKGAVFKRNPAAVAKGDADAASGEGASACIAICQRMDACPFAVGKGDIVDGDLVAYVFGKC